MSTRRGFLVGTFASAGSVPIRRGAGGGRTIPAKTVVLTFDDAVKSHHTLVAPLLKKLDFGATFFVTHNWMDDAEHFMTWREIAEIHQMGFEIGNHSWTHADFSVPRNAARLAGELALVENELKRVGVPRPTSFAYTGNFFGPEAVAVLDRAGYRFARRGGMPEVGYGKAEIGSRFVPGTHHRLLIPTTGDAYPNWTIEHFRKVAATAAEGQAVVLQFHGVPDIAHPWVDTPPDRFHEYMTHLQREGFRVIAMRDLQDFVDLDRQPNDPILAARNPARGNPDLPIEMQATRAERPYWDSVMRAHRYTASEVEAVVGRTRVRRLPDRPTLKPTERILPYPGGRHPRTGFLNGAIDPLRGTKASIFIPWDRTAYVVVDLPEAIFSNLGLLFLAHTDVPTIWNERNKVIDNVDWRRRDDGGLESEWTLPNKVRFGATVKPDGDRISMELGLSNGTDQPLTKLRTQICVMVKGAPEFSAQTNDNKIYRGSHAAARNPAGDRWIITSWEHANRASGNPACPCFHADPVLPDCGPGETVRVHGRLWFYQGRDIEAQLAG